MAARPLDRFFRIDAVSGILILFAAEAALLRANSPWAHSYGATIHTLHPWAGFVIMPLFALANASTCTVCH